MRGRPHQSQAWMQRSGRQGRWKTSSQRGRGLWGRWGQHPQAEGPHSHSTAGPASVSLLPVLWDHRPCQCPVSTVWGPPMVQTLLSCTLGLIFTTHEADGNEGKPVTCLYLCLPGRATTWAMEAGSAGWRGGTRQGAKAWGPGVPRTGRQLTRGVGRPSQVGELCADREP